MTSVYHLGNGGFLYGQEGLHPGSGPRPEGCANQRDRRLDAVGVARARVRHRDAPEAGLSPTQLSKYYAYAMKAIWEMNKKPSDASFLLFCPDYQKYFINETNLKALLFGAPYRIVLYSTVLEAFEDAFPKDKLGLPDSSYFHDFVLALRKHAREKDDDYETEIKKRFFNAIFRIEHP